MSWPVALEKRSDPSPRLLSVLPVVAIGIGLLLGAIVLAFVGTHPGELISKWREAPLVVSRLSPRRWLKPLHCFSPDWG